jgi:hypothetical protein
VAPRLLLIFENGLAFCRDRAKFDKAMRRSRLEEAAGYWDRSDMACRRLLWLYFERDVNIEIVTFLGEDFAAELKYWMDDMGLPVHRVWGTTPEKLGRNIAYMPDLACVYDPEPERWLMYGSKGRYLTDINQIGEGL